MWCWWWINYYASIKTIHKTKYASNYCNVSIHHIYLYKRKQKQTKNGNEFMYTNSQICINGIFVGNKYPDFLNLLIGKTKLVKELFTVKEF